MRDAIEPLQDIIRDINRHLNKGAYVSESGVSKQIVMRLLQGLQWELWDPNRVSSEFRIANTNKKVDYALRHGSWPVVLIEVKDVGKVTAKGEDQLFEYCLKQGVPLAVLTDGATWSFYFPAGMGSYEQRRFAVGTLADEEACARLLCRYLGFESVTSGDFRKNAQQDYDDHEKQVQASEKFEEVFHALVTEGAPALVSLFCDHVERRAQARPHETNVRKFLRERTAGPSPRPRSPDDLGSRPPPRPAPKRHDPQPGPAVASFTWFGETVTCVSDTKVFVEVMKALGERESGTYERIAPELAGRTRRVLARNREDLYAPDSRRVVLDSVQSLPGGWWLATHSSSSQKDRTLRRARELAGIVPRDCSWRLKGKV